MGARWFGAVEPCPSPGMELVEAIAFAAEPGQRLRCDALGLGGCFPLHRARGERRLAAPPRREVPGAPARLRRARNCARLLLGGAAATPELIEQANALPRKPVFSDQSSVDNAQSLTINNLPLTINHSPLVAPTYGLSEAASQVATMLPADAVRKPGSVGKPLMFTRVKIVDEAGEERP